MLGQRATLYHQRKQLSTISHNDDITIGKQSTFDQLKKQIQNLQNSQFLCMKYRCNTEPDQENQLRFKMTGKEFMPSKKIAQLQKYKMHLRKKGRTRKISLLLEKSQPEQIKEHNCVSFLEVKDFNTSQNHHRESSFKKKETPSIVRKYYRPQTGNTRSMSQLSGNKAPQTQVRGLSLKSSNTNRCRR